MKTFLDAVRKNWQAVVALASAFIAGTVFMGTMFGFINLPAIHAQDIKALDLRVTPIEVYIQELGVLNCIRMKQALDEPVEGCVTLPR